MNSWGGWWWTPSSFLSNPTIAKDRLRWEADRLWKGTHTVSYLALAVTTGQFRHPPARAWVNEEPEIMGMSPGQLIRVDAMDTVDGQVQLVEFATSEPLN